MDFRKAFDSVCHDRLLIKTNSNQLELLGNYGSGSKHIRSIDINVSKLVTHYLSYAMFSLECLKEVFWALCCSLLLLMIYLTILSLQFPSFLLTIQSVHIQSEDVEKLQTDINNAAEWNYLSNLPFNETKFVYLRFWAKDTDHPSYVINGKSIKQLQ